MSDIDGYPDAAGEGSAVARSYDRWAPQYDVAPNATRDLDAVVLRAAPLPLEGADVLELGCGTGKNTGWLGRSARQLLAMDLSAGMLEIARRRISSPVVRFVQHDLRDPWPTGAGSMDVVVGNLVLEHLRDLAPIYAEAARVLRSGGTLFVSELHPFRQLLGGQAHFTDERTGELVHVPAFPHSISEFVNSGIEAGLTLRSIGEWRDRTAEARTPPRLVTLAFAKP